jgi:Acetyltransferase (GNAT) domain
MRSTERGGTGMAARIERFATLDALPPEAESLFAANPGLFSSPAWWRNVLAHGVPADSVACFLLCRLGDAPAALFPMRQAPDGWLFALTTPYTCLYQPLLDPRLGAAGRRAVFTAFARFCRGYAITWLDSLDAGWPHLAAWISRARAAGLVVLRFDSFGNWHEPVAGLSWQQYLTARPGALRETIRRRLRRAEREASAGFQIVTRDREVEAGIAAYESVYARSWKQPEPFPAFKAGLMRAGAKSGWLRLGIFRLQEQPVAAQLWAVDQGVATVLKLAHDEAFRAFSPGTVLTAWMLRHLLDEEHVTEIDFGRGDDSYKQGWAGQRRQRVGLVLANPLRSGSLPLLARHALGRLRAAMQREG